MRLLSILTAIAVTLVLYAGVFERAWLLELAGRNPAEAPASEATQPADGDVQDANATPTVRVVVMRSTATIVDSAVSLRGQTEAMRQVDVQAETSGRVGSAPLRSGTFVNVGDTLCEIAPGTRPAQLAEAEARLAEAEIADTAAVRLAEGGFGSETRSVSARAALQSARAAVAAARTEIDRLVITAPFDGVLETDTAELGSLMQPGTLCARVIQLDPMKIVGFVPETLVEEIDLGAPATARLSSGREIAGEVTFLSRSADPATRTFRVEITTPNADLALRDGQSADIAVRTRGVAAHRIPASALTLDDGGTMGLRSVDDTGTVRFDPVRLLRDTPDGVLVTGLPDAVRVITVGQEFVTEGVAVEAVEAENGT